MPVCFARRGVTYTAAAEDSEEGANTKAAFTHPAHREVPSVCIHGARTDAACLLQVHLLTEQAPAAGLRVGAVLT